MNKILNFTCEDLDIAGISRSCYQNDSNIPTLDDGGLLISTANCSISTQYKDEIDSYNDYNDYIDIISLINLYTKITSNYNESYILDLGNADTDQIKNQSDLEQINEEETIAQNQTEKSNNENVLELSDDYNNIFTDSEPAEIKTEINNETENQEEPINLIIDIINQDNNPEDLHNIEIIPQENVNYALLNEEIGESENYDNFEIDFYYNDIDSNVDLNSDTEQNAQIINHNQNVCGKYSRLPCNYGPVYATKHSALYNHSVGGGDHHNSMHITENQYDGNINL